MYFRAITLFQLNKNQKKHHKINSWVSLDILFHQPTSLAAIIHRKSMKTSPFCQQSNLCKLYVCLCFNYNTKEAWYKILETTLEKYARQNQQQWNGFQSNKIMQGNKTSVSWEKTMTLFTICIILCNGKGFLLLVSSPYWKLL